MVAIAAGQKDILRIMLDSALKVLDVTGQNASIVLWAIENDHVTLLQVCFLRCYIPVCMYIVIILTYVYIGSVILVCP